jgi:hypothetical protein
MPNFKHMSYITDITDFFQRKADTRRAKLSFRLARQDLARMRAFVDALGDQSLSIRIRSHEESALYLLDRVGPHGLAAPIGRNLRRTRKSTQRLAQAYRNGPDLALRADFEDLLAHMEQRYHAQLRVLS